MPNPVLTIEPQNELKFKVDFSGLFEQGNPTFLRLTNPTYHTVLFKIKTTAPKKYCVRPNSGIIEPFTIKEIAITPQPAYVDSNEKHKHKFMVQSIIAPDGKTDIDQVWKDSSPEDLMDYKLRCVFETPHGTNLNDSGDNAPQNEATKKRVAVADESKPSTKDAVEGLIQNEAKRKDDDPAAGSLSAKTTLTQPKSDSADNDLQKEVGMLRDEESKLRQENLRLKEELLRLHPREGWRSFEPEQEKSAQITLMPWLATTIGMVILGIIIGKFLM